MVLFLTKGSVCAGVCIIRIRVGILRIRAVLTFLGGVGSVVFFHASRSIAPPTADVRVVRHAENTRLGGRVALWYCTARHKPQLVLEVIHYCNEVVRREQHLVKVLILPRGNCVITYDLRYGHFLLLGEALAILRYEFHPLSEDFGTVNIVRSAIRRSGIHLGIIVRVLGSVIGVDITGLVRNLIKVQVRRLALSVDGGLILFPRLDCGQDVSLIHLYFRPVECLTHDVHVLVSIQRSRAFGHFAAPSGLLHLRKLIFDCTQHSRFGVLE